MVSHGAHSPFAAVNNKPNFSDDRSAPSGLWSEGIDISKQGGTTLWKGSQGPAWINGTKGMQR